MLVSLSIRDIVLIEKLDLTWSQGLCSLTGETGAGKSILLDALALATGARGDASLVRQGAEKGQVSAAFEVANDHEAAQFLMAQDMAFEGQIILRRVQTLDGRSRAYINDQPVSVNLLNQIGAKLVEIHGQNESQSLTDANTQRLLLDSYAGHQDLNAKTKTSYHDWQDKLRALTEYEENIARAQAEEAYLRHALEELTQLDPQLDEEASLSEERSLLMNSEKISADLNETLALLEGDETMRSALSACLRRLENIAPKAGGLLDDAVAALSRTLVEAEEALALLNAAGAKLIFDPARLQTVEERLFALKDLARKHQVTVNDLPALKSDIEQKLESIEGGTRDLESLRLDTDKARQHYEKFAQKLSASRTKAAQKLDAAVMSELKPLKLEAADFETQIETRPLEQGNENGLDHISFMASTNPGMPKGAIAKIASGGELARFMLALKVSLAASAPPRSLVFDEVDAGVGGAVAQSVGTRLKTLAQQGQVMVVTHSPQVAACGDHHWRISKQAENQSTLTHVQALNAAEREEEIARMLSGAEINDAARQAARELLGA